MSRRHRGPVWNHFYSAPIYVIPQVYIREKNFIFVQNGTSIKLSEPWKALKMKNTEKRQDQFEKARYGVNPYTLNILVLNIFRYVIHTSTILTNVFCSTRDNSWTIVSNFLKLYGQVKDNRIITKFADKFS